MNLARSCDTDAVDVSPATGTKHMHEFENPLKTSRPILTLAELVAFDPGSRGGRKERRFCCPLPGCESKPRDGRHRSLSLDTESGLWHCFRCGSSGQVREAWRGTKNAPGDHLQTATPSTSEPERSRKARPEFPPELLRRAEALRGTPGAEYLESRGLDVGLAHLAGARYSSRYFGRPAVLFPLTSLTRSVVAIHGRYVTEGEPRMRTIGRKQEGLFATPGAFTAERVAVSEAPIDALSLASAGLASLALCGTSWPHWLAANLSGRTACVAFDADDAGDAAAAALGQELTAHRVTWNRLRPSGVKDWNEALRSGRMLRIPETPSGD